MWLISSIDKQGLTESIKATVPDTNGAAKEVPELGISQFSLGLIQTSYPGAHKSTLALC